MAALQLRRIAGAFSRQKRPDSSPPFNDPAVSLRVPAGRFGPERKTGDAKSGEVELLIASHSQRGILEFVLARKVIGATFRELRQDSGDSLPNRFPVPRGHG